MSLYNQRNQNIITLENLTGLYFVPCSSPEYLSANAEICSWHCWGPFRKEMKPQKGKKTLKVLWEFRSETCVVTMIQGLMYIYSFTAVLSTLRLIVLFISDYLSFLVLFKSLLSFNLLLFSSLPWTERKKSWFLLLVQF